MAYSALTTGETDQDSPITEALMVKIKDNFDAILNDGILSQASLKTATGEISTSGALDSNEWPVTKLTLPGGQYGFRPQFKSNGTDTPTTVLDVAPVTSYITSSYVTSIHMGVSSGSSVVYAIQRYVNASPPYKINGIDYPLFVFCHVVNGKIISTYSAEDPPWAHNGPTDITPDFYKDGIGYKKRIIIPDSILSLKSQCLKTYSEEVSKIKSTLIKVCTDFKNSDMNLIPHPFQLKENEEIVLACPDDSIMSNLLALLETGGSVSSLIHDGYLELSNQVVDVGELAGGVICRKLKWKNTGN